MNKCSFIWPLVDWCHDSRKISCSLLMSLLVDTLYVCELVMPRLITGLGGYRPAGQSGQPDTFCKVLWELVLKFFGEVQAKSEDPSWEQAGKFQNLFHWLEFLSLCLHFLYKKQTVVGVFYQKQVENSTMTSNALTRCIYIKVFKQEMCRLKNPIVIQYVSHYSVS